MADAVRIEGMAKLRRELRKVSADLPREMTKVGRTAAGLVADTARTNAPRRSGRLAASIKTGANAKTAYVKAGGSRLPYAKPIHFGWPRHNITPQPFLTDALEQRRNDVIDAYRTGVRALVETSITPGTGE